MLVFNKAGDVPSVVCHTPAMACANKCMYMRALYHLVEVLDNQESVRQQGLAGQSVQYQSVSGSVSAMQNSHPVVQLCNFVLPSIVTPTHWV